MVACICYRLIGNHYTKYFEGGNKNEISNKQAYYTRNNDGRENDFQTPTSKNPY